MISYQFLKHQHFLLFSDIRKLVSEFHKNSNKCIKMGNIYMFLGTLFYFMNILKFTSNSRLLIYLEYEMLCFSLSHLHFALSPTLECEITMQRHLYQRPTFFKRSLNLLDNATQCKKNVHV